MPSEPSSTPEPEHNQAPQPAYPAKIIYQFPEDKPAPLSELEICALCFPHQVCAAGTVPLQPHPELQLQRPADCVLWALLPSWLVALVGALLPSWLVALVGALLPSWLVALVGAVVLPGAWSVHLDDACLIVPPQDRCMQLQQRCAGCRVW